MEADAVTQSHSLSWAPRGQLKRGKRDHMSKRGRVKIIMGKQKRQVTWIDGSSKTLGWLPGNLHGTKLDCLNVSGSYVVWSVVKGGMELGPGHIPDIWTSFLEPIPIVYDTLLRLDTGGGAWSCFNLAFQTLLTPQKRVYLLWGVCGVWEGREIWEWVGEKKEGGAVVDM